MDGRIRLECYFGFLGCQQVFHDLETWDQHCRAHLGAALPSVAACPFPRCGYSRLASSPSSMSSQDAWGERLSHLLQEHGNEDFRYPKDGRKLNETVLEHLVNAETISRMDVIQLREHGKITPGLASDAVNGNVHPGEGSGFPLADAVARNSTVEQDYGPATSTAHDTTNVATSPGTSALTADVPYSRPLHASYQVRAHARRFFVQGRVFMALYTESGTRNLEGSTLAMNPLAWTQNRFGEWVYTKPRRFVVVLQGDSHFLAVPITTYGEQGVAKPHIRKSEHCIIYSGQRAPLELEAEKARGSEEHLRPPIKVDVDDRSTRLDPMSRVNYARVVSFDFTIKVKNVGMVNPHFLSRLATTFQDVMFGSMQGDHNVPAPSTKLAKQPDAASVSVDGGKEAPFAGHQAEASGSEASAGELESVECDGDNAQASTVNKLRSDDSRTVTSTPKQSSGERTENATAENLGDDDADESSGESRVGAPDENHSTSTHDCTHCSESFAFPKDIQQHVNTVHSEYMDKNECSLCQKTFRRKDNLRRHIRQIHPHVSVASSLEAPQVEGSENSIDMAQRSTSSSVLLPQAPGTSVSQPRIPSVVSEGQHPPSATSVFSFIDPSWLTPPDFATFDSNGEPQLNLNQAIDAAQQPLFAHYEQQHLPRSPPIPPQQSGRPTPGTAPSPSSMPPRARFNPTATPFTHKHIPHTNVQEEHATLSSIPRTPRISLSPASDWPEAFKGAAVLSGKQGSRIRRSSSPGQKHRQSTQSWLSNIYTPGDQSGVPPSMWAAASPSSTFTASGTPHASSMPTNQLVACDETGCNHQSRTAADLRKHKQTHLPKVERSRPHVCTICGKAFRWPKDLMRHDNSVHMKLCPYCPETLFREENLQRHITTKHPETPAGETDWSRPSPSASSVTSFAMNHRSEHSFGWASSPATAPSSTVPSGPSEGSQLRSFGPPSLHLLYSSGSAPIK